MKELTREAFGRRARGGGIVPVYREFLADMETPVSVLSRAEGEDAFLLESVASTDNGGRYSFLGVNPYATLYAQDGRVFLRTPAEGGRVLPEKDVLAALRSVFREKRFVADPDLPPLQGGAIGYLAYDAVRAFEPRVKPVPEEGMPDAAFLLTDSVLVFDNRRRTALVVVCINAELPGAYDEAMRRIDALHAKFFRSERPRPPARAAAGAAASGNAAPGASGGGTFGGFTPEMTPAEYAAVVEKCKEDIRNGECIQIVPSQKFTMETSASALALYRALRVVNPSPYNFFLKIGARTLIGSSPEELVKLSGRTCSTCPIAGTRPRGATPEADAALERELAGDEKENAEHVMLVDLGRNDLGRVCETGTVKVDSFARVERFSHVMHLVSDVSGTLAADKDGFDLLRSAFPAGTLTGAPKIRAMELLAKYEKSPRGVYGGAAGYFSFTGDIDFAIVIRTMVLEGRRLSMRAGAGIVADSDPFREYGETINKSKAAFEAAKFAETL